MLIRWSFSFFTRGRGSRVIEDFGQERVAVARMGAGRKEPVRELYAAFSAGDREFFEGTSHELTSRARDPSSIARLLRALLAGAAGQGSTSSA